MLLLRPTSFKKIKNMRSLHSVYLQCIIVQKQQTINKCDIHIQMGADKSKPFNEELKHYKVLEELPEHNQTHLAHTLTEKEYLLRQLTFNDQNGYIRCLEEHKKRKTMYTSGVPEQFEHLTRLERVEGKEIDHLCSKIYKVYALWEYPYRQLGEQLLERRNNYSRKFEVRELWSILASCILAMSCLQKQKIRHEALTTKSILLDEEGMVRIADPLTLATRSNLDTVYNNRHTKGIYLSPEQCEALESRGAYNNPFKNDVWSMGMVLLECGLLEDQSWLYKEEYGRIDYVNLQKNLQKLGSVQGQQIQVVVELMLKKDCKDRPDWIDLEQYAKKSVSSAANPHNNSSPNKPQINNSKTTNSVFYGQALPTNTGFHQSSPPPTVQIHRPQIYQIKIQPEHHQQDSGRKELYPVYGKPDPYEKRVTYPYPGNNNTYTSSNIVYQPPSLPPPPASGYYSNEVHRPLTVAYSNYPPASVLKYNSNYSRGYDQSIFTNPALLAGLPHFSKPSYQPPRPYKAEIYEVRNYDTSPSRQPYNLSPNRNYHQNHHNNIEPQITKTSATYLHEKGDTAVNSQTYNSHHKNTNHSNNNANPNPHITNSYLQKENATEDHEHEQQQNQLQDSPEPEGDSEPDYVVETFKQGSRYEGYKLNDMRHGEGKFYYQDGGLYSGNWKCNKMDGYGALYYQSGKLAYRGDWSDDQFQGHGQLFNQTPQALQQAFNYRNFDEIDQYWEYYQGNFVQDFKKGHGKLKLSNGQYFEGHFENDMVEGPGIFYTMDGNLIRGVWQANHLVQG